MTESKEIMLTLDVAICTYRPEGIERVVKMLERLPQIPFVNYVVSWQEHQDAPLPDYLKNRKDVKVFRLRERGLSNNRNNALDHCTSDVVLIADDDIIYYENSFQRILKVYEERPELDLATFKFRYPNEKKYPESDVRLKLPFPKYYYGSSIEVTFRRSKINGLRYWPGLGLGAKEMESGEDEFFIVSAIKRGYNCWFINEYIGTHPNLTTGDKCTEGTLKGQGFIIGMIYPVTSLLRIVLKAYRTAKCNKKPLGKVLNPLVKGWLKSKRGWRDIDSQYRW